MKNEIMGKNVRSVIPIPFWHTRCNPDGRRGGRAITMSCLFGHVEDEPTRERLIIEVDILSTIGGQSILLLSNLFIIR